MCNPKPNFFILGAPKCGTTSLAHWLAQHRAAFMSPSKEPHHFNTDMRHRIFPEVERYNRLFEEAGPQHRAIGEASVWYLYSADAVPNIERELPESKYIVCLRNPTDMFHSLHMQQLFSGNEAEQDAERAWNLADERRKGAEVPPGAIDPMTLIYPDACALGSQLQRLFSRVPRERVLVILLEEMSRSPEEVLSRTLHFLDLPEDPDVSLAKLNEAKVHRYALANRLIQIVGGAKVKIGFTRSLRILSHMENLNTKAQQRVPLDPGFRARLIEHFRPEVELLARLLETNLEAWNA